MKNRGTHNMNMGMGMGMGTRYAAHEPVQDRCAHGPTATAMRPDALPALVFLQL